jgi:S-DNA-T family DNA segregation ATPase FtsK/SpoIIIE
MGRKKKRGRPKKRSVPTSKTKKKEVKKKKPKLNIHPETKRGIITVILFAIAVIFVLSFQGVGGLMGDYVLEYSKLIFGACLWLIPIVLIASGIIILRDIHESIYLSTFFGVVLFILSFLGLIQILFPNGTSKAGWLGYLISWPFMEFVGFWVTFVIFAAVLVVSVLIAFNIPLKKPIKEEEEGGLIVKEEISKEIKGIGFSPEQKGMSRFVKGIFKKPSFETKKISSSAEDMEGMGEEVKSKAKIDELIPTTATTITDYTFPPIDLLEADKGTPSSVDIKANMNIIEKTLENFNISVEMGEINVGPTVTQYTLRPASGVKLSKITALHRDISLTLAAHPIRIEAPIPGRSLVGIELPNKTKTLVRLRDLLAGFDYKKNGHYLNICLGRDVAGEPTWANLVKMPHLLIAGSTGSGKSITIHSIITSLLYQKSPWELKFILIDPKRVELPLYNGIPHLLTPVIVDVSKVINAFKWAIRDMEERYKLLADIGAKDLASYNEKIVKINPKDVLPYIVIVVDELADIMAAYGKEIEALIVRLAQMARAIGIHLVLSTQRPSVEVITGLIKANITSRIALQVASQVDSRTVLDTAGAERQM